MSKWDVYGINIIQKLIILLWIDSDARNMIT